MVFIEYARKENIEILPPPSQYRRLSKKDTELINEFETCNADKVNGMYL